MNWHTQLKERLDQVGETLRIRLSNPDAVSHLALVGLFTGIAAGGITLAFRLAIEGLQRIALPGDGVENYEGLTTLWHFSFPVIASLLIIAILARRAPTERRVGVSHVIERLNYHQGQMSKTNLLVQFTSGIISIVGGHSVGREGPSVHLGGASGSLISQYLGLPNNSTRVLVGCGAAGAIAASFNTPLAGVIFAMEVLLKEYTVSNFVPVIIASVSAASMSQAVFGASPAFDIPPMSLNSLFELPLLVILGATTGLMASLFVAMTTYLSQISQKMRWWLAILAAGVATGAIGIFFPEIMGVGYDTVNLVLLGDITFGLLMGIILAKLLATSVAIGFGLPGGMIGATIFLGSCIGGIFGALVVTLSDNTSAAAFYAILGMAGMMGATLHAPLFALCAILELTTNSNIILPGMLVIVSASLVNNALIGHESVFVELIRTRGMDYRDNPFMRALRSVGIASVMEKDFTRCERILPMRDAINLSQTSKSWILIHDENRTPISLMNSLELRRYIEGEETSDEQSLDLLQIPAKRYQPSACDFRSTLQDALQLMDNQQSDAIYIEREIEPGVTRIYGVAIRENLEQRYR